MDRLLRGIAEDRREFFDDLAQYVEEDRELQNADISHGHRRALEMFESIVPYELQLRSCVTLDPDKLKKALDDFYNALFSAFRKEVHVTVDTRLFGLRSPVTVDRSGVGNANVNNVVIEFQQALADAVIR